MSQDPIKLAMSLFTQFWREPDTIVDRMDRSSITVPNSGKIIRKMASKLLQLFPYPEGVVSDDLYHDAVERLARFFRIDLDEFQEKLHQKGIPYLQISLDEETKLQMVYLLTISAALEIVHLRASETVNEKIREKIEQNDLDMDRSLQKLQELIFVADSAYSFLVNIQILQSYASLLDERENGDLFKEIKEQLLALVLEKIS